MVPYPPMPYRLQDLSFPLPVPPHIRQILNDIKYRDWSFDCRQLTEKFTQVSLAFEAPCVLDGYVGLMTCADRVISNTNSPDEIVRQVLAMILGAHEHEAREHFLFRGQRIFDPHSKLITLPPLELEVPSKKINDNAA